MCCRGSARCDRPARRSTHEYPRTLRTRCPPGCRDVDVGEYSINARARATMARPARPFGPQGGRMRLTRRRFLRLSGAGAVAATLPLQTAPARAQSGPVRLGVLAAKAGVLAPVGESVLRSLLTARHWKGKFKTVAGINPDYSYGRDNWAAFLAIMKKHGIELQVVSELWPKLGATDFTSHVATLAQAKPDLIFSCFWAGDTPIFMKQAHAAGLTRGTKFVLTTGGGVHESLKKDFTPEGALLGYNCFYFENPKASPLAKEFTRWHAEKFKEWPNYESDHGYFTVVAFKAAAERAAKAAGGKWPTQDAVIQAHEGVEAEWLSGPRRYREDHIMEATFFQGVTTHRNKHDFVTIDPVESMSTKQIQKPSGVGLYDWINSWKV